MKMHTSLILFVLLLAGAHCQSPDTTTAAAPTETTTVVTTPTSVDTTTMADTTTASAETTTKTVPTTEEAPTTTQSPTTQSPTTQSPTTQSPTTTPKTTTSTKSTPTPSPVVPTTNKPPVAELGSWNVTEGNVTCIRADLKIRFMIPNDGKEYYIALSPNATAEGSCNAGNGSLQELTLTDSEYILTFIFEKDDKSAFVRNISLNYRLPGDTGIVYNDTSLFKVKVGNSYLCSNTETVPLRNVSMEVFQIHLQAFGSTGNGDFGTPEECEADDKVNDIVPIAVGCCLLALVVIVLIAYFVGRRRSRQKGYQSV